MNTLFLWLSGFVFVAGMVAADIITVIGAGIALILFAMASDESGER